MPFKKIQEYINTADGTEGTLLIPKLIMPTLIEEVDKNLLDRSLAAQVWGPNQIQGSTFNVNLETKDTMDVREVGEGAEIPLDNIELEAVSFTPVKYGVAIRITREMMEDSQFELLQRNIRTAGKRFAENETNLVVGSLDGAGNTVAGGATLTLANITEAMQNLEDNDYNPTDMIIGTEILNDLRNIDVFVEANKSGDTTMLTTGFRGNIYGMSVHLVSQNFGSNASKTTGYVLDRSQAYGIAIKRDITVENFTLPTFDMQGASITQRITTALLRSNAVSKITTT